MALGDIVQTAPTASSNANVSSMSSGTLGVSPTAGNTLIMLVVASAACATPTGWTLDTSDVSFDGIYIFRRTVQAGDPTSFTVSETNGPRPISIFLTELSGTAAVHATATPHFYTSLSTANRVWNTLTTTSTAAILTFGGDTQNSAVNWNAYTNSLVHQQHATNTAGTSPPDGDWAYLNGAAAGTYNITATSGIASGHYQLLAVAYTFSAGGGGGSVATYSTMPMMGI